MNEASRKTHTHLDIDVGDEMGVLARWRPHVVVGVSDSHSPAAIIACSFSNALTPVGSAKVISSSVFARGVCLGALGGSSTSLYHEGGQVMAELLSTARLQHPG